MSSKTPIILKKDADSQRIQYRQVQPKILKSKTNQENIPIAQKIETTPKEPKQMKKSLRFVSPHFQLDPKILDYLDSENTDFLVVGVLGTAATGKSTIMNLICKCKKLMNLIRNAFN